MAWGVVRLLLAWLGAAIVFAAAPPAFATNFPSATTCHASALARQSYAELAAEAWRWDCEDRGWSIERPRAFLRFDLRGTDHDEPHVFVTRLTRFQALRITVIGIDGRSASHDYTEAGFARAANVDRMAVRTWRGK